MPSTPIIWLKSVSPLYFLNLDLSAVINADKDTSAIGYILGAAEPVNQLGSKISHFKHELSD